MTDKANERPALARLLRPASIAIVGASAEPFSVGANTLDVAARHPERFEVFALSAATQVDAMLRQCLQFRPAFAVMAREEAGRGGDSCPGLVCRAATYR